MQVFPENFLKNRCSSGKKWIGKVVIISADKFQRWQINNEAFTGLWCDIENSSLACAWEKALAEWLIWDLGLVRRVNSEKLSIWLILSLNFAMSWSQGKLLTHWDKKSLETRNFVAESCTRALVTKACWERWNIFYRFGWEGSRTKYKQNTLGQSNNPCDIFILPGLIHWYVTEVLTQN